MQAVFDEVGDEVAVAFFLAVDAVDAIGFEGDEYRGDGGVFGFVVEEADVDDFADAHAVEVYRRALAQAACRVVEVDDVVFFFEAGALGAGAFVFKEGVYGAGAGRGVVGVERGRGAEGDAAAYQCFEGFDFEVGAFCPHAEVDAADVPEFGVVGDEAVVGRVDEGGEVEVVVALAEADLFDLSDADAAVVDGGADVDAAGAVGNQAHAQAFFGALDLRRFVKAGELVGAVCVFAGADGDVVAGDDGAKAGDAARADLRFDDPELAVFFQQWLGSARHLRGNDDLFEVVGEVNVGDGADGEVFVADFGFACFQSFGAGEGDVDVRADLAEARVGEPEADAEGDDGQQPEVAQSVAGDFGFLHWCSR